MAFLDSRELDLVRSFNDRIEKPLPDLIKNHHPELQLTLIQFESPSAYR